ncbi:MAG: SDR family oxidoreductase [Gemmatimonadota bacterium]|nr:MAG: SDR family oxidoreductase [Gemmatimonadota bacterium]
MSAAYLVFGATGGIGSALCRRIVNSGNRVAVAARSEEPLAVLAEELGGPMFSVDATDAAAVAAVTADATSQLGRLDGIVNCVGSVFLKPAHLTSPDEWDTTIATNLTSAFAVVRAAGNALRDSGGSVVLLASAAARTGLANHEAIAAAKGGVMGLALSAAATYSKANIRFNVVAPGLVKTSATARITESPAGSKASLGMHPLGRFGEPEDIAAAIEWLLDPTQTWITGQVIGVDGGLADLKLH